MQWPDVVAQLRAAYTIDSESDDWLELRWRFVFEGDTVEQHQTVRSGTAYGELFVVVAAELPTLDPAHALRHNATLAIGALAIEDGRAILRAGILAETLTAPHLDRVVRAIAEEAARLAARSRADIAGRPNPFARLYADAR